VKDYQDRKYEGEMKAVVVKINTAAEAGSIFINKFGTRCKNLLFA
jgi:hypothetical protein